MCSNQKRRDYCFQLSKYTEEEYKKLRSAMKTVPTDGADVTPWAKSAEPKDTYKHSPVSKPKKNKYGI